MSSKSVLPIDFAPGDSLTLQAMQRKGPKAFTPSDISLVQEMLLGDEKAFRAFFDMYFPRVYRFALPRLAGDIEATREVVQASLVKAVRSLEGYRAEAALFSWLCQICRSQIADYVRMQKRYANTILLADDQPELRRALESIEAPAEQEPSQRLSRAEARALVQSVLDRLPARYGDVLEWKYVEGRSVEEIGELLGVGSIAAQSILARARASFREALETVFGATARDILIEMIGGN